MQINSIEASPFDPGTAYFAATMYKFDDFQPYLYKTTDYGKTWTTDQQRHSGRAPSRASFAKIRIIAICCSPEPKPACMFPSTAATTGSPSSSTCRSSRSPISRFKSARRNWWSRRRAAPFGSSTIFRCSTSSPAACPRKAPKLFQPKDTYRSLRGGFHLPPDGSQGQNPASGAVVYYSFKEKPKDEVTLEFLDDAGKLIRKFSSKPPAEEACAEPKMKKKSFHLAGRMRIACPSRPVSTALSGISAIRMPPLFRDSSCGPEACAVR